MSHNEVNVKWRPQTVFSYGYMGSIEYKIWGLRKGGAHPDGRGLKRFPAGANWEESLSEVNWEPLAQLRTQTS